MRPVAMTCIGLLSWAHGGTALQGGLAHAGSLYWDPGTPGYPAPPPQERSAPRSEARTVRDDDAAAPIIEPGAMQQDPAAAISQPKQPAGRTIESERLMVSPPSWPAKTLDLAPAVDSTGVALLAGRDDQIPEHADAKGDGRTAPEPLGPRAVAFEATAFLPDPVYQAETYDPEAQILIYGGKTAVPTQRPIPEIGRPLYQVGPLGHGTNLVGRKNLIFGHLYGFGDWRTAVAFNNNAGDKLAQIATRLNLDLDLGLTATERLHALFQPLQKDGNFTRCEFAGDDNNGDCEFEIELAPQTLFFEGDLGAITAGITDSYRTWDLPITGGLVPLLFQNGVWMEDAILGGAFSIPALNSSALDISNADVTVFAGFDDVDANGVTDSNGNVARSNVNTYGIAAFIEALEGYVETGYAYVDAEGNLSDQDYHSATIALTRRYGGFLSNSLRLVGSFGQHRDEGENQNGLMILAENSWITSKPYQLVPYGNFFIGIDRPVPLARQNGILKNTGINFESDALTGFPFLDDTGQNAYGGALGLEYLFNLDQQLVVEVAGVRNLEDISASSFEEAVGNQYAVGARYQLPLNNAWLLRADVMYGWRESEDGLAGIRTELRFKF